MDEDKRLQETSNPDEKTGDFEEFFEGIPEEHRKEFRQMMISSIQMGGMISSENVVSKKLTEEHITQYLEGSRVEMEKGYREKLYKKIFLFLTMLVAMVFFVVIVVLLKDIPEIMEKIIYSVVGLVAGAFGGYGVGKNKNDD